MDRLQCAIEFVHFLGRRKYVSGLLDRLVGRGLDGNTHAPLISLADRSISTILANRFWVRFLVRSMQFSQSRTCSCTVISDRGGLNVVSVEPVALVQNRPGDPCKLVGERRGKLVLVHPL